MTTHHHTITNLRGEKFTGTVKVRLRPGMGIQVDGKHIEGGPHEVPIAIAQQLIDTNRADPVSPDETDLQEPQDRDPVVESRDPRAIRRR